MATGRDTNPLPHAVTVTKTLSSLLSQLKPGNETALANFVNKRVGNCLQSLLE